MKVYSFTRVYSAYDVSVLVFRTEDELERYVINKAAECLTDDPGTPPETKIDDLASAREYLETQLEALMIDEHDI